MGQNYLSIPKIHRLHRWSLGMDIPYNELCFVISIARTDYIRRIHIIKPTGVYYVICWIRYTGTVRVNQFPHPCSGQELLLIAENCRHHRHCRQQRLPEEVATTTVRSHHCYKVAIMLYFRSCDLTSVRVFQYGFRCPCACEDVASFFERYNVASVADNGAFFQCIYKRLALHGVWSQL